MARVNNTADQPTIIPSSVASTITSATIHYQQDVCIVTGVIAIAASIFAYITSKAIACICALTAISTVTSTGIETAGGRTRKFAVSTLDNVCCCTRGGGTSNHRTAWGHVSSSGQDTSVRAVGTLVLCWSAGANMGFVVNWIKDVGKHHQRLGLERECS